jgi:hypothetical protein
MASRRTTHHTIHRRLFTRVVPRVAASKKQPNGESDSRVGSLLTHCFYRPESLPTLWRLARLMTSRHRVGSI